MNPPDTPRAGAQSPTWLRTLSCEFQPARAQISRPDSGSLGRHSFLIATALDDSQSYYNLCN